MDDNLATYAFDPTREIVATSITVAGAAVERGLNGSVRRRDLDVDGDGRDDLVVYVRPDRMQLTAAAIEAPVTAQRRDGSAYVDADWVTITR